MKKMYVVIFIICSLLALFIMVKLTNGKENASKTVVLETSKGDIIIELYSSDKPITSDNFAKLVSSGFYDGTLFHRVIDGFMIQGGDPLTKDSSRKNYWGTGGPGYKILDEFGGRQSNDVGTIAMANSGPNTGGSQFFINLVNNNFLDSKHPVFGKVISGQEIVESIGKSRTDSGDRPLDEVRIIRAYVK